MHSPFGLRGLEGIGVPLGGGVPPLPPTPVIEYGKAISFVTNDAAPISPAQEYFGYANWNSSAAMAAGTGVDSDGNASAATYVNIGLSTAGVDTNATDNGHADFAILSKGLRGVNNTTPRDMMTVSNIPYARYDVFLFVQDNASSSPSGTLVVETEGRERFFVLGVADYDGLAAPDPYDDYNRFAGLDTTSFTLTTNSGAPFRAAVTAVVIAERLDSVADVPTSYPDSLAIVGDSWGNFANNQLDTNDNMVRLFDFYCPVNNYSVGGTLYSEQYTLQIVPNDLTSDVLLWWEGYVGAGAFDVSAVMTLVANMTAQKGDDRWMMIVPSPAPGGNSAAYIASIDALYADMVATYGEEYVFDPRPTISALDPGDTSVGGLPASVFRDSLHLTDEAYQAVLRAARGHLQATWVR